MNFYGFQKTTLIDYPEEVAATLFTFGCNMRCPYCHNKELVLEKYKEKPENWDEIKSVLVKRKNVLTGVCITGGEPTLHSDLINKTNFIKSLGLKVKIDTNGTNPNILKKINPDYIAMDIKTSIDNYNKIGLLGNFEKEISNIKESINYIINSGIKHEFRTTLAPGIVDIEDIKKIIPLLTGADKYSINQFRNNSTLKEAYTNILPYNKEYIDKIEELLKKSGLNYQIRINYN